MQVLAGPRQVGKSTLVGQVLQDVTIPYSVEVADAVEPKDSDWIRRVWEGARTTMMLRGEAERLLVIDEIQKIDNWSEVVKREWDEGKKVTYLPSNIVNDSEKTEYIKARKILSS